MSPTETTSSTTASTANYLPIQDYGIIGNMHTAAIVGMTGSIDWFCYPHFALGEGNNIPHFGRTIDK